MDVPGFTPKHRNLLVARVQITTYNLHVLGSFPPSPGCLSAPSLLGGWEPTRLSNQPVPVYLGSAGILRFLVATVAAIAADSMVRNWLVATSHVRTSAASIG